MLFRLILDAFGLDTLSWTWYRRFEGYLAYANIPALWVRVAAPCIACKQIVNAALVVKQRHVTKYKLHQLDGTYLWLGTYMNIKVLPLGQKHSKIPNSIACAVAKPARITFSQQIEISDPPLWATALFALNSQRSTMRSAEWSLRFRGRNNLSQHANCGRDSSLWISEKWQYDCWCAAWILDPSVDQEPRWRFKLQHPADENVVHF